jgi:hypothetical protein
VHQVGHYPELHQDAARSTVHQVGHYPELHQDAARSTKHKIQKITLYQIS